MRKKISDGVKVSAQFPGPMMAKIDNHLNDTGLTLSEFLRRAVDNYLSTLTRKAED